MATAPLTADRLRRDGEAFMEAVSREWYLAHSGHAADAKLQAVYAQYAHILGDAALDLLRGMWREAPTGSPEQRSARLLLEWLVESQAGRALAPLDEREIAWEHDATITLDTGETIPFGRAPIDIGNEPDRTRRAAIDDARAAKALAELAPLRLEKLERERDFVEQLEIADGYIATFDALSGVAVAPLAEECRALLRDTQAMWDTLMPEVVRAGLGIAPREATRADALFLMRGTGYDAYFPANAMAAQIRRQVSEMGLDPTAQGRVRFDTEDRPGKRSRAFCSPVQVPDEVYLVLRPSGGQSDWMTFLHELGHAMHFGYMRPDLPFEDRWMGDHSITEGFAMLFDHRMQDGGWLRRYSELGAPQLKPFLRASAFEELQFLRRYCGKLLYEMELYGGEVSPRELPDRYVEMLGAATGFRYQRADAFLDVDPRFYATRYLRAWQLQALFNEVLTERYNEDWWRNPEAGPYIAAELFGPGQREVADEMALRVSGRGLSFAPVVRALERHL